LEQQVRRANDRSNIAFGVEANCAVDGEQRFVLQVEVHPQAHQADHASGKARQSDKPLHTEEVGKTFQLGPRTQDDRRQEERRGALRCR